MGSSKAVARLVGLHQFFRHLKGYGPLTSTVAGFLIRQMAPNERAQRG